MGKYTKKTIFLCISPVYTAPGSWGTRLIWHTFFRSGIHGLRLNLVGKCIIANLQNCSLRLNLEICLCFLGDLGCFLPFFNVSGWLFLASWFLLLASCFLLLASCFVLLASLLACLLACWLVGWLVGWLLGWFSPCLLACLLDCLLTTERARA